MSKFLLVVLLVLLAGWLLLRRRDRLQTEVRPSIGHSGAPTTAYHAVSIKFAEDACFDAKAIHGQRFLASNAPQLPLKNCDSEKCVCRFAHHEDRRAGKDRRSPFGASGLGGATGRYEKERREGRDRRKHTDPDN